jgi:hypothetical protein
MHLIDLTERAAACKAVYAGSIPTPASKYFNALALACQALLCVFGESTFAIHSGADAETGSVSSPILSLT